MNTLTTAELKRELDRPGNWESLYKLSVELLRRLEIAESQVEAWQRHDRDVETEAFSYCPQPHRMVSDDR